MLPYFKRSENHEGGANEYHGVGGPLTVSEQVQTHLLCDAFIEAAKECGYPHNPDVNGASQDGFGYCQATIRNGRRASVAQAFLAPVRSRPNLTVLTHALATPGSPGGQAGRWGSSSPSTVSGRRCARAGR